MLAVLVLFLLVNSVDLHPTIFNQYYVSKKDNKSRDENVTQAQEGNLPETEKPPGPR